MLHSLILVAAVAWGQTTQPATTATRPAGPRIVVQPTTRPAATTQPFDPQLLARLATQPAFRNATSAFGAADDGDSAVTNLGSLGIDELSGNPVDVEVTADGTIVLYGDKQDVAILERFILGMDKESPFKPEFRIFHLESGDANDLARKIQQLWDAAKRPQTGQMRPEDRMTIIPEPRSNILMVAATAESMNQIEQIVVQLDKPALGELVQFESIQLVNIKAAEAEATLRDLLKSLQERRGATRELVTMKANPRLNMLLVNAPEADLK
ncbi:MAG TPA: secretin N-terminal domain-containing protein, partial [Phycisphaerae bacterium]|nr:secretin N-terminal domain-containing protein [Phycisphaerae bacterium]